MASEAIFSVWVDTKSGDLMTFGTNPGRAMTREAAWKKVQEVKAPAFSDSIGAEVSYVRVFRGCTRVFSTAKFSDGTWTSNAQVER